jgi:hypothetical protein
VDILSFDAYQVGEMPGEYASAIGHFIRKGGIISWGLVPTDSVNQSRENPSELTRRIEQVWKKISLHSDLSIEEIAANSLIAPARCCLKNVGKVGSAEDTNASNQAGISTGRPTNEEVLVETAFDYLREVSGNLQYKYSLTD